MANEIIAAVYLYEVNEIVAVPLKFVSNFRLVDELNNRDRHQVHRIFWSKNKNQNPNFGTECRTRFDANTDACYFAKMLRVFGTYDNKMISFFIKFVNIWFN